MAGRARAGDHEPPTAPGLGQLSRAEASGRRRARPPAAVVVVVGWALLSAGLCSLLDMQRPADPAVLATAAVVLAGAGALLGIAVVSDRRAEEGQLGADLRQAAGMLRSVEAVTDPALAYLDLDELLSAVLGRTKDALDADVAAVLLADDDGSTYRVRASSGMTELAPVGSEVARGEGLLGSASSWGRAVVVPDVRASGAGALPEWQEGISSLVAAPLIVLGGPIGSMEVASRTRRMFDAAERRVVQSAAGFVAAALERARLGELAIRRQFGAEHANLRLRLLARGGTALGKALYDYDDAMEELADVVVPDFADWFGMHVLDDEGALREVVARAVPAAFPGSAHASTAHPHPKGDVLARAAMASRRSQFVIPTSRLWDETIDATVHTYASAAECPGISSMLVVPVEVRGAFMGSLTFVTGAGRRGYRPSDLETGRELTTRVAVAIERVCSWQAAQRARDVASRYAERLRRLVDVSLVLNSQLDEEEVLALLVEHTRRALVADVVAVRTSPDPTSNGEEIAAEVGAGATDGLDARRDRIAAPIIDSGGATHRVIVAVGPPGATYSREDLSVLTVLAHMASVAVRNARLYCEVAENEQRLETVLDSSPLAIVGLRPSGEAQWWNRAAAALFGWPDRSAPRRIPVRPEGAPVLAGLVDSSFNGKRIIGVALPITGAGGRPLELSISASPLGPAGAVSGALVVAEDVTDRMRMLGQLHQAERLQAMSRMAGALAHDFNNLLTVILGCGDALMRRLGDDEELGPDVAAIHRAGTRAAALTSQLVRIGGQRPDVEPELVRIDEVVTAMGPILAGALGERVRLRVVTEAGGSTVRIDRTEIERCLLNLVLNARDAMPDGGTCTVRTARVSGEGGRGRELVELSVADDGTGMDEETAAHCFEPFFTTKGRARGTGLGLAALHAMISQAGGDVDVTSSRGHGTTFTITLPIVAAAPVAAASAPLPRARAAVAPGGRTARLLVVDDELEVLLLVVRQLESAGYDVLAARNASEALHLLATHGPVDLLVTDVVMPGMNGIELAGAVRLRAPEVKVLFVSGHLDDDSTAPGSLPGHAALVTKPFGHDELARAVRTLLRDARTKA